MIENQTNLISFLKRKSISTLTRACSFAKAQFATRSLRLSMFALALVLMHSHPLHAQAQRSNTNTASAVLHIQVTVVPTTFSPSQTPAQSSSLNSVSYSLPSQTGMDVIQQSQTLPGTTLMASVSSPSNLSVLQTTTVVPR